MCLQLPNHLISSPLQNSYKQTAQFSLSSCSLETRTIGRSSRVTIADSGGEVGLMGIRVGFGSRVVGPGSRNSDMPK